MGKLVNSLFIRKYYNWNQKNILLAIKKRKYERKDLNLKSLNEYLMEKELDFLLYDIKALETKKFYLSRRSFILIKNS